MEIGFLVHRDQINNKKKIPLPLAPWLVTISLLMVKSQCGKCGGHKAERKEVGRILNLKSTACA